MTNSLFSTATFLAVVLCGTPLLAQQATDAATPANPADPAAAASPANPADPAVAASPQPNTAAPGVRIVRLSQVTGEVQLDRQTGRGFEGAFANLPITQGGKLRTGVGVAEVEFEDNSSLRLTPHSIVEFPVLSLGSDGTRSSTIHVVEGAIYVSLTKGKQNNVNVTFGRDTLALGPAAHIELALTGSQPRLDVLDGTVQAINGSTTTTVGRKKALLFDPSNSAPPTLLSKNEKGPLDAWDKQAVEYHQRMAPSGSNYAGVPYAYGLADMNYYGNFGSVGGCGSMWRPYLVSANWSPYDNGVWAYYPDAGYSWVSPYPWGWTAFHSGSWNYCQGAGWGWQPSSQWNGLQNTALVKRPNGPTTLRPPIAKPHPLSPTMIPVNEKPLVVSKINEKDTFVFRKDSAGLGVPRSTFGKLDHISAGVAQHGSVEKTVFVSSSPNGRPQENGAGNAANHGTTATHTMPASGHSALPSHSSPSGGTSSMGGRQSVSGGSSRPGASGPGASMGGPAGGAAGHSSGTGHH
jgi:hypothetical protein